MKKFKKIYIEITNKCNLNCSFCPEDNLIKKTMSLLEFETILKKIDSYTDYIYLHVKGEPLIHSEIDKILLLCKKYNKNVNITTNGTLLKKRMEILEDVRQINISLQSITDIDRLYEILDVCDELSKTVYISYRLWVQSQLEEQIILELEKRYNKKIERQNIKLKENIFINFEKEFIWPNLENEIINENGTCYGTRDHIGILVDGTVIPCCLDSKGIIGFGNIYSSQLEEIIKSERFMKMEEGFKNNKLEEELCKKCGFFNRK